MSHDPLEDLIEEALVEALPTSLVLTIEDGLARGCEPSRIMEIMTQQNAGPLLRRGVEILCERHVRRTLARQRTGG